MYTQIYVCLKHNLLWLKSSKFHLIWIFGNMQWLAIKTLIFNQAVGFVLLLSEESGLNGSWHGLERDNPDEKKYASLRIYKLGNQAKPEKKTPG